MKRVERIQTDFLCVIQKSVQIRSTSFIRFLIIQSAIMLQAQTLFSQKTDSNLREKTIETNQKIQQLDTLTIAQPLEKITDEKTGQTIENQFFKIKKNQIETDTAALRKAHPDCQKIRIKYRVLPFDLARPHFRIDTAAVQKRQADGKDYIGYDYSKFENRKSIFENSGLTTAGAYTRGLSFGNAQNLNFNSNLNLQLEGKISQDLELRAAISDNSIPLQPDGTTRQLQEFDRIFLQLKKKNSTLSAGDFDLVPTLGGRQTAGHFTRYFKRVQGAEASQIFSNVFSKNKTDTLATRVAFAISRGKFNRQIIAGQEGNQGPYRLQGAENEQFIIVLAGTEKVFLDGILLRRGLQDDYIIDYNLGEITFTPRQLITKDRRVIVEFEYSVQNFLRSTAVATAAWQRQKSRFVFQAYTEQDSRNAGPAQELTPAERSQLALAGDNLKTATAAGIDTLENFDPARVLYVFVDTTVCGGQKIRVLKYSTSSEARLAVRFSQVGAGQGNYRQVNSAANGRVFQWVAPDAATCQPTGNFEPVVRLIAPEQKQMFTFSTDFQPFTKTKIRAESALTRRDLNRFSPLDDSDNSALGTAISIRQNLFSEKTDARWQAATEANFEILGKNFQPLNPYRTAEFARDWNVEIAPAAAVEHLSRASIFLKNKDLGEVRYDFGSFVRAGQFEGFRNVGRLDFARGGFKFFGEENFLTTSSAAETSRFSRPKFGFAVTPTSRSVKARQLGLTDLKVGVTFEREKNARSATAGDSLLLQSFWYDYSKIYFQVPENQGNWTLGGFVARRDDHFPTGKNFTKNTRAREANLRGGWQRTGERRGASWQANFTVRDLDILEKKLSPLSPQRTFLGRLDWSQQVFRNAISWTSGYEIGSGQSPKTEFQYILVNPGEGQYAWVDRNRDSILQVDEMETAVFQDQARYVRVSATTPNFIRTNNLALNHTLRLEPKLWWRGASGWRKFLGKFSEQSVVEISRRVRADGAGSAAWNPLDFAVADSLLVTLSASSRHSIFFNRANPKWDLSLTFNDLRSQLALTTGFESRSALETTLHGRVNLQKKFSLETDLSAGRRSSDHDLFSSRRYDFSEVSAAPKLTWLPDRFFRMSLNFVASDFSNSENLGGETARRRDLALEINWNPSSKPDATTGFRPSTALRLRTTFAKIEFDGLANSALGYAMLEGLQDGQNWLWTLALNRQLSRDIQISVGYDGRRTAVRTVHTGSAQVRANF